MTVTLETLGQQQEKTARRQRAGVFNRYLGWVILPLVIAAIVVHYMPDGRTGTNNEIVKILQFTFVPLMLVHVALSIYVFGLVRPARTLRVFHVWFGYAYMLTVLMSQLSFGHEPLHLIATAAMFFCLTVHIAIGVFYAMRRRQARVEHTPVAL